MRHVLPRSQVQNFKIPKMEIMGSGHSICPGCGISLSLRYALKALGRKTILVVPACCCSNADGSLLYTAANVPVFYAAYGTAAFAVSGIRAALDFQGKTDVQVVLWAADSNNRNFEFWTMNGADRREENFICVCCDDQAAIKARFPKSDFRGGLVEIMAARGISYAATASVAYPDDFIDKFHKAKRINGTRLIHIHLPCPPLWKISANLSIQMARLAVQTRLFPLYEVENGEKYTVNVIPERGFSVEEFLSPQGRFQHMTSMQMEVIQKDVERNWKSLLNRAAE
ncbi:pyruvate synthase subunit beta [bacterium]|nr:pyruvate synthase subunit beta [bacterium]